MIDLGRRAWKSAWQPTPVLLPGEFHGPRSLAGYSPWRPKELEMTAQLILFSFHFLTFHHPNVACIEFLFTFVILGSMLFLFD